MNRSGSYETTRQRFRDYDREQEGGSNLAVKEGEVVLMNMIAVGLALGALALFIVGMLIGTGVINSTATPVIRVEHGAIWLLGAISLGVTAAIFRREHHIVDPKEYEYREQETERQWR